MSEVTVPFPSVAEVLTMPVLAAGRPRVITGQLQLDREVRWVHVSELADIARLLRVGDLVLTTGIALPQDSAGSGGLAGFASSLADVGAAGLVVELGRRWQHDLPDDLVAGCGRAGLPLVALDREVSFASVAQGVGERIVEEQLAALRESEQVHDIFTDLGIREAGPAEVLRAVSRLSGATAVVEDADHRVVDVVLGPDGDDGFLDDWTPRSRRVQVVGRTSWDATAGWLVTHLGAPERRWGRLVTASPRPPEPRAVAVVERGASALALHLLHSRDRATLVRRRHGELIDALVDEPGTAETEAVAERLGFTLRQRRFVAVSGRPMGGRALEDLVAAAVASAERLGVPVVADTVQRTTRVLLSLPDNAEGVVDGVVDDWVRTTCRRMPAALALSRPVDEVERIGAALRESAQVMRALPDDAAAGAHRLEDAGLRGLLTLLADDDRVALFAERQLRDLEVAGLLDVVAAHVHHTGNKTAAAGSLYLSRPAFYARLARAEAVLGRPLDDADTLASLRVALLTREVRR